MIYPFWVVPYPAARGGTVFRLHKYYRPGYGSPPPWGTPVCALDLPLRQMSHGPIAMCLESRPIVYNRARDVRSASEASPLATRHDAAGASEAFRLQPDVHFEAGAGPFQASPQDHHPPVASGLEGRSC